MSDPIKSFPTSTLVYGATRLQIYEACYPSLVRCYGEDAAQDAGEKLVTHPPRATEAPQVKAWLHRVARHAQVTSLRRTHREVIATEELPEMTMDPRPQLDARLALREYPRETLQQVCEVLDSASDGKSTKATKLFRLRKRLREGESEKCSSS